MMLMVVRHTHTVEAGLLSLPVTSLVIDTTMLCCSHTPTPQPQPLAPCSLMVEGGCVPVSPTPKDSTQFFWGAGSPEQPLALGCYYTFPLLFLSPAVPPRGVSSVAVPQCRCRSKLLMGLWILSGCCSPQSPCPVLGWGWQILAVPLPSVTRVP